MLGRARSAVVVLLLCILAACYGAPTSDLSSEGHGRPQLTLDFPSEVAARSTQTLTLHVTNPGPGDIPALFVAFTNVGVAGSGIGTPIVPFGHGGKNPAVAGVDPKPDAVSDDGVVYRFPGLDVGDSATIAFSLVMPKTPGPASNSVQVYDGDEPDRAVGMRLATIVGE